LAHTHAHTHTHACDSCSHLVSVGALVSSPSTPPLPETWTMPCTLSPWRAYQGGGVWGCTLLTCLISSPLTGAYGFVLVRKHCFICSPAQSKLPPVVAFVPHGYVACQSAMCVAYKLQELESALSNAHCKQLGSLLSQCGISNDACLAMLNQWLHCPPCN